MPARTELSSFIRMGTTQPNTASHATPASTNQLKVAAAGTNTTIPTSIATGHRRRATGRPASIAHAPMYAAVNSGARAMKMPVSAGFE